MLEVSAGSFGQTTVPRVHCSGLVRQVGRMLGLPDVETGGGGYVIYEGVDTEIDLTTVDRRCA